MLSVADFCIAVVSYGAKRLQLWQGECPEQVPVTGVGERRIRNRSRLDGEEKEDVRGSLQACKAQLRWGCGLLALLLPQPQPQPLPGRMEGGQGREPQRHQHAAIAGAAHPPGWEGQKGDTQRPPGGLQCARSLRLACAK